MAPEEPEVIKPDHDIETEAEAEAEVKAGVTFKRNGRSTRMKKVFFTIPESMRVTQFTIFISVYPPRKRASLPIRHRQRIRYGNRVVKREADPIDGEGWAKHGGMSVYTVKLLFV